LHAHVAIAATRVEQEPLGYLNATSAASLPATDYISDGCLALPATDASAPLVMLAVPATTATELLPHIAGSRQIGSVAVQGGQPYLLYETLPGSALRDEQPIATPATTNNQPQPSAYAYLTSGGAVTLNVRWVGAPSLLHGAAHDVRYWYGADPRGEPIANYAFIAQALNAQGQPIGAPIISACDRLAWTPQISVDTSTPLPASLLAGRQVAAWRVSAQMSQATAARPTAGPFALETGAITFGPARPIGQPVTFAAALP
jgi:hypothetical protein